MARNRDNREVADALKRVTSFDGGTISAIASVGRLVTIPERWSIIHERTPADKAYVLLEGTADVRKDGETIAALGPGDVFGEIALVDHRLRSASVVATSPITAVHLTDSAFADLLRKDPSLADRLRGIASARLAQS